MTELIVGFSVGGALLVMMALGIVLSALIPSSSDRWSKRYFITLFSLMFLCSVSCFLALTFWYDPHMAAADRVVYFFESVLLSSLMVLPTVYLLHCCGESFKSSALPKAVAVLSAVFFAMRSLRSSQMPFTASRRTISITAARCSRCWCSRLSSS